MELIKVEHLKNGLMKEIYTNKIKYVKPQKGLINYILNGD